MRERERERGGGGREREIVGGRERVGGSNSTSIELISLMTIS